MNKKMNFLKKVLLVSLLVAQVSILKVFSSPPGNQPGDQFPVSGYPVNPTQQLPAITRVVPVIQVEDADPRRELEAYRRYVPTCFAFNACIGAFLAYVETELNSSFGCGYLGATALRGIVDVVLCKYKDNLAEYSSLYNILSVISCYFLAYQQDESDRLEMIGFGSLICSVYRMITDIPLGCMVGLKDRGSVVQKIVRRLRRTKQMRQARAFVPAEMV